MFRQSELLYFWISFLLLPFTMSKERVDSFDVERRKAIYHSPERTFLSLSCEKGLAPPTKVPQITEPQQCQAVFLRKNCI